MNVSNLQLQGLYLVIASINNALVAKGVLTREQIASALHMVNQFTFVSINGRLGTEALKPSNRSL